MRIRDILNQKGHEVVTIAPDRTVAQAVQRLVDHDIGALVVEDDAEVVGIISERDVLRLGNHDPGLWEQRRVEEVMTRDLLVGVRDDDLDYVMEIMTENRIRHLPIVEDGELRGIVSIGDVVNASRRDVKAENRYLRQYIQGDLR